MIKFIAAACAIWAVVYLIFAFVLWDVNAATWSEGWRLCYVIFAAMASAPVVGAVLAALGGQHGS